jgi:hypothetical protein
MHGSRQLPIKERIQGGLADAPLAANLYPRQLTPTQEAVGGLGIKAEVDGCLFRRKKLGLHL